jgi:hypothetical protein
VTLPEPWLSRVSRVGLSGAGFECKILRKILHVNFT